MWWCILNRWRPTRERHGCANNGDVFQLMLAMLRIVKAGVIADAEMLVVKPVYLRIVKPAWALAPWCQKTTVFRQHPVRFSVISVWSRPRKPAWFGASNLVGSPFSRSLTSTEQVADNPETHSVDYAFY
jgi:hypothetical protein